MYKIDIDSCLDTVCKFVRIYNNTNKTPTNIYKESNYEKYYHEISIESIINKIKSDESIFDEWELFSLDKRWSPAWGLFKNKMNNWSIFYIDSSGKPLYELIYEDRALACAHMIKFEMEELRLNTKKFFSELNN